MQFDIYTGYSPTINENIDFSNTTTFGVEFFVPVSMPVLGVSFWKSSLDTGVHTGGLYNTGGTLLASGTFSGETATGWQTLMFASPYWIAASTHYVAAVYHPTHYGSAQSAGSPPNYWNAAFTDAYAPISVPVNAGRYKSPTAGIEYPNNTTAWSYFVQPIMSNGEDGLRSLLGERGVVGYLKGISLGGPTSLLSDTTFGRHLQIGVRQDTVEGNPSAPCLALDFPGFWRFRWGVAAGSHTLSVLAKQVSNVTGKRPSIIVKANPDIGVSVDVSASAGGSAGWVTIGPVTVTPTSAGVLWVELWNNDTDTFDSPAFFDHRVTT